MKKIAFFSIVSFCGVFSSSLIASELVVYSARMEPLIAPLFEAFEKEEKIKVKYITGKAPALMKRLQAQKSQAKADVFITVDAGNLYLAKKENLFSPVKSTVLNASVPAHLRDPEGHWFGLSIRARSIFYNKNKVDPKDLSSYEELASEKWKGRLCLRTSKKVYNKSLVAALIAHHGEKKTESIVRGWVSNLATSVFTSDSKLLEAIDRGQCDVGIANTYYYGRLRKENPKTSVAVFWPNQKTTGVHINVSGAGILKNSKNKKQAQRFLEWMASVKAQKLFARSNMEYPVLAKVEWDDLMLSLGRFKADDLELSRTGALQRKAVKLMDRVGYK